MNKKFDLKTLKDSLLANSPMVTFLVQNLQLVLIHQDFFR